MSSKTPLPLLKVAIHEEDDRGNVYTLLESFYYCGIEIPAGFESDGASVPRFFWSTVFPPGDSKALRPAIIHDYIYRTHPTGWTRKMADENFHSLLVEAGISKYRAYKAYLGVRLFGQSAWEDRGKGK